MVEGSKKKLVPIKVNLHLILFLQNNKTRMLRFELYTNRRII